MQDIDFKFCNECGALRDLSNVTGQFLICKRCNCKVPLAGTQK